MKKMMFTMLALLTVTVAANAMSYEQARNEALFLTDKMAYELNLTDAQYEAAYEINLDYLMGVTSPDDVYGAYWERRNMDLSYILYSWQWDAFRAATYFFRPLVWDAGYWHFTIYRHYPHRDYFFFGRPHFYATYRGGHSWRNNGGHSFYYGRSAHFRPELSQKRQHFGMRDGYNRGNYRNGRDNSSTRITAGRGNFGNQRGGNNNNGSGMGNQRGGNGSSPNTNRSFGNGSSNNRSISSSPRTNSPVGSASPVRNSRETMRSSNASNLRNSNASTLRSSNAGTMRSSNAGTMRSSGSSANRSMGGSSHGSSAPSRSNGGNASSHSGSNSNGNGHFGGRR